MPQIKINIDLVKSITSKLAQNTISLEGLKYSLTPARFQLEYINLNWDLTGVIRSINSFKEELNTFWVAEEMSYVNQVFDIIESKLHS